MRELTAKIPIPFAGVMLGSASLGNLLQPYSQILRNMFGMIALFIFLLFLSKIIIHPKAVVEDMKNPIFCSTSGAFFMGVMLLTVYAQPFLGIISMYIWYLAVFLHFLLILHFTKKFIFKLDMKNVFGSYFIVYVGIVVAATTAPVFGQQWLGVIAFWLGFVSFFPTLFLVGYRCIKGPKLPEPAQPLICILAAPISLSLAGYMKSFDELSSGFVVFMITFSIVLYIVAFIQMIKCLRLPFYPSYSAFTFPFVISAIAAKEASHYLGLTGPFQLLVVFQISVATILVVYTIIRYLHFFSNIMDVSPAQEVNKKQVNKSLEK